MAWVLIHDNAMGNVAIEDEDDGETYRINVADNGLFANITHQTAHGVENHGTVFLTGWNTRWDALQPGEQITATVAELSGTAWVKQEPNGSLLFQYGDGIFTTLLLKAAARDLFVSMLQKYGLEQPTELQHLPAPANKQTLQEALLTPRQTRLSV